MARPSIGFTRRAVPWLRDLYAAMQSTRTFGLAAETAFWLSVALIPLAAVAGLVAARLTTHRWDEFSPVLGALPSPTRAFVTAELRKMSKWHGGTVGVTGTVVFVWLGSTGVHAIFEALEVDAGIFRPWWKKRALALSTCVVLSIVVAMLALLAPGLDGPLNRLARSHVSWTWLAGVPTLTRRLIRFLVSLLLALGYVSGLYWVGVPRAAHARMPILPGAVVAVLLQACLSYGYSVYISQVGSGSVYTAGLAIIGFTLMGLYLFVVALLVGAVVNRQIGRSTNRQPE